MAEKNFKKKVIPEFVRMFHNEHEPVDIFPCEQSAYEADGWGRVEANLKAKKGKTPTSKESKSKTEDN